MDISGNPLLQELLRTSDTIYAHGWAERNGGNISMLLDDDFSGIAPVRTYQLGFHAKNLNGTCIAITGSGKYLKNIRLDPETNLGILRINGDCAELLWGLRDGSSPSSELAAHLLSHSVRRSADPAHRVVTHTHATNLVAMTFIHALEDRAFTRTLWNMCTECLMFFPDGVSVLPWMPCGTDEIGRKTAEKMQVSRLVVWAHHGVFGAGTSPDDALGLIEVAEKAAEIYLKISGHKILSKIDDTRLKELCTALNITPREGYLDKQ
jgi:rhamnulose-1-phosphate aldolase